MHERLSASILHHAEHLDTKRAPQQQCTYF